MVGIVPMGPDKLLCGMDEGKDEQTNGMTYVLC